MSFKSLQANLQESLIERQDEIECLILAMVAKEHALFVGTPGTAKSLMLRSMCASVGGANYFECLMMKDTSRDELIGTTDMEMVQTQSKWQRDTNGFLPECHFAFLDEIWKSSSAAINSMLGAMEERTVRDYKRVLDIPLNTLVAASNEWPIGENYQEVGAAFDRFLIRKTVLPVSSDRLDNLLFADLKPVTQHLTLEDLDQGHKDAMALPISTAGKDALIEIITKLREEGISPGDRRCRKSVKIAKAAAYLSEASEVLPIHLEPLQHVLWEDPTEHPAKCAEIVCKIANPIGAEITRIQAIVAEQFNAIDHSNLRSEHSMDCLTKLEECATELSQMNGNGRAQKVIDHIQSESKPIWRKVSSMAVAD